MDIKANKPTQKYQKCINSRKPQINAKTILYLNSLMYESNLVFDKLCLWSIMNRDVNATNS